MENSTQTNIIFVDWEFDIENDEQTQEMLGLIPEDMEAILDDPERLAGLQSDVAKLYGVPQIVDLSEFFEDPHSCNEDQITDALSDQFGWLVNSWSWHQGETQTCNSDDNHIIINHKDQQTISEENNMETNIISTPSANEDSMITQLFQQFIDNGGEPKVTEFKKHLNELINSDIKHLCGRAGKSASGDDWRSLLKAKFSGRGAKWVIVPLNEISLTISNFEAQGINCDNYKTFIEMNGGAWIRFAGSRIDNNGNKSAAFEVRTEGSTIDHPKQLHLIPIDVLDETIRPLGGTPRSLKLEELPKAPTATDDDVTEETETHDAEDTTQEVAETPEVTEPETLEDVFEDFVSEDFDQFDEDMF